MSRLNILDYFKKPPKPSEEDMKRREVFLDGITRFEETEPSAFAAMMDYWDAEARGAVSKVLDPSVSDSEISSIRYRLMAISDLIGLVDAQKNVYDRSEWIKQLQDDRTKDLAKREEALGLYATQHKGMM